MTKLIADLSISLDGFVAGPDPSLRGPARASAASSCTSGRSRRWRGARRTATRAARATPTPTLIEALRSPASARGSWAARCTAAAPAPWEDDPNAARLVGRRPALPPPRLRPHPPRARAAGDGGRHDVPLRHRRRRVGATTRRRAAAGGKDVQIHGGGSAVPQFLRAGLLDELTVHIAPVFLGSRHAACSTTCPPAGSSG